MKKNLIHFLLGLALVATADAQTIGVKKNAPSNTITEDLVIGPGRTLTIAAGGAINAADGSTVDGFDEGGGGGGLTNIASTISGGILTFGGTLTTGRTITWRDLAGTVALTADLSGYQPLDSDLTSIAALTTASYGRGLLELADQAALRTYAGLGTAAEMSVTSSEGSPAALSIANHTHNLAGSYLTGTLPVTKGGTGINSGPTNGQLLIGVTSGNQWTKATLTGGTGITVTNGAGSISLSVNEGALTLGNIGGTLGISKGGTGATSAGAALTNLGAQPLHANLTDLADTAPTKGRLLAGNGSNWVPLSVGTDGQVLSANSAAATGLLWTDTDVLPPPEGSGLEHLTETLYTASPNGTINTVELLVSDGTTKTAFALSPKGGAAVYLGPKADGTATGGNVRGDLSADLQMGRTAADQIVSGYAGIMGGYANKVTGNYGGAFGHNSESTAVGCFTRGGYNIANWHYNFADGYFCTATQTYSHARGNQALADRTGLDVWSSGKRSVQGDTQISRRTIFAETNGDTPTEVLIEGSVKIYVPAGMMQGVEVKVIGRNSSKDKGCYMIRQLLIQNEAATTALIGSVVTVGTDIESDPATDVTLSQDDSYDALKLELTGLDGETWYWAIYIEALETK